MIVLWCAHTSAFYVIDWHLPVYIILPAQSYWISTHPCNVLFEMTIFMIWKGKASLQKWDFLILKNFLCTVLDGFFRLTHFFPSFRFRFFFTPYLCGKIIPGEPPQVAISCKSATQCSKGAHLQTTPPGTGSCCKILP